MRKIGNFTEKDIIDYSYLGLDDFRDLTLDNPLYTEDFFFQENPHLHIMDIMRKPENFPFTCKHLLNFDLMPYQHLILEEMWSSPFPMLVGSRGMAKTTMLGIYTILKMLFEQGTKVVICGAAFRQSKMILEYVESVWDNAPILKDLMRRIRGTQGMRKDTDRWTFRLGSSIANAIPIGDGCLSPYTAITYNDHFGIICENADKNSQITKRDVGVWGNGKIRMSDEAYYNGIQKTKKIVTKRGFSFEGTYNHAMKVLRDGKIVWCRSDEMKVGDHILIDRSFRWHNGDIDCTLDDAYILGAMIGDGSWTNKYFLRFTGKGGELAKYLNRSKIIDKKFTKQDDIHYQMNGIKQVKTWLDFWGLEPGCYTPNKCLPSTILKASRKKMAACLSGLFDTDGGVHYAIDKRGGHCVSISFWNTSEKLIDQIQFILLHFGIIATKRFRHRGNLKHLTEFSLQISGSDCNKFAEYIGFRMKRKQKTLVNGLSLKTREVNNQDIIPGVFDEMIRVAEIYQKDCKGSHLVTAKKIQDGRKNATRPLVCRFLDRYSSCGDKFIDELNEIINPDIYYDSIKSIEDGECETYDIHVPEGNEYCANGFFSHNSKIRGLRANLIIADEFRSINERIFEEVIRGFAAVANNPVENVKKVSRKKMLKKLGYETQDKKNTSFNQTIISGTAGYIYETFGKYWKKYHNIIKSRGDEDKLLQVLGGPPDKGFDWHDYKVIRIPFELIPEGFMDAKQVAQAKSTTTKSAYLLEYGAVFVEDSEGFFRRKLIEQCTAYDNSPVMVNGVPITFSAKIIGDKSKRYVMGIDPASESDNFSIVILELCGDHRRVVYSWTMTRSRFKAKVKKGLTMGEDDFYDYATRKIRELLAVFPCDHIGIDKMGGGVGIIEALQNKKQLREGEVPIYPYVRYGNNDPFFWEPKENETDNLMGLHILHVCQFANTDFVSQANHGMKQDMESGKLLFPFLDSISLELAIEEDKDHEKAGRPIRVYDSLEDCMMEIEDLKDELASIVHTQTPQTGRERWDTPEIKLEGGKKGRDRKDRYSALLIANMVARVLGSGIQLPEYTPYGGFAHDLTSSSQDNKLDGPQKMYVGNPQWDMNTNLYGVVSRRRD